jgi:anti-sigma factor ChrR (cupin superfamily)
MSDRPTAEDLEFLNRMAARAISPVDSPDVVRAKVLEAIRPSRALDESVPEQSITVRSGEGNWKPVGPGTRMKRLVRDERRVVFLLELEPGALVEAHDHDGAEDTYVIRGSCRIGSLSLSAGDFHHVEALAHHGDVVASPEGCLVLITLSVL